VPRFVLGGGIGTGSADILWSDLEGRKGNETPNNASRR